MPRLAVLALDLAIAIFPIYRRNPLTADSGRFLPTIASDHELADRCRARQSKVGLSALFAASPDAICVSGGILSRLMPKFKVLDCHQSGRFFDIAGT
jgi:hypothetical protein